MKANETALVMIEFQKEFLEPGGKLYGALQPMLEQNNVPANAEKLLKGAKKKGLFTVACQFNVNEGYYKAWGPGSGTILCGAIWELGIAREGQNGTELIDLVKENADAVVRKDRLSAFAGTELDTLLRARGIKNLILCGFFTQWCVETTARQGYDLGYTIVTVPQAMATADAECQKHSAEKIFPGLGAVMTVEQALAAIQLE